MKAAKSKVVITGGAGFIGCNLADRCATAGEQVLILDSLGRPGVERNLAWLTQKHGEKVTYVVKDIRDYEAVVSVIVSASSVYHFASQVAVTTSLENPFEDFEVNARGTLNVLEAVRNYNREAPVIFASTNKVYGKMKDVPFVQEGASNQKYRPQDNTIAERGFDESRPLDLYSPYGCSKGAADQYVLDYARVFGLRTAVMRMSCIYGPRQFGTEDQGWVAHFAIRALRGEEITIYGDGHQVRDILFVDDAVDAYLALRAHIDRVNGEVFNLGGGPENAVSLWQLIEHFEHELGHKIPIKLEGWRPGDQVYYVSDTTKLKFQLGLGDTIPWKKGVSTLVGWLREHVVSKEIVAVA